MEQKKTYFYETIKIYLFEAVEEKNQGKGV
jgi:hypothetical protein